MCLTQIPNDNTDRFAHKKKDYPPVLSCILSHINCDGEYVL